MAMTALSKRNPSLTTSQNITTYFGCKGSFMHLIPGFQLLRAGDANKCPHCGEEVTDLSHTPVGQAYFAFHRPDLGAQQ